MSTGAAEVLALIDAIANHRMFDEKVDDATVGAYSVVRTSITTAQGEQSPGTVDLTLDSGTVDLNITVHNVGNTAAAARSVQSKTYGALSNARVVVAGRKTWPIRHVDDAAPVKDESTGKLIVTLTDVYRLRSVPALESA